MAWCEESSRTSQYKLAIICSIRNNMYRIGWYRHWKFGVEQYWDRGEKVIHVLPLLTTGPWSRHGHSGCCAAGGPACGGQVHPAICHICWCVRGQYWRKQSVFSSGEKKQTHTSSNCWWFLSSCFLASSCFFVQVVCNLRQKLELEQCVLPPVLQASKSHTKSTGLVKWDENVL